MTVIIMMTNNYQTKRLIVIGAGLMGCGIAQVFASKQIRTVICDPIESARSTALDKIKDNLDLLGQDYRALEYLSIAAEFRDEVGDADFVIEAVPEKLSLETCDRIIGTHWWNPPYLMPLVEVVQSDNSSVKYVEQMMALLRWVGKEAIHVKKDITGFVANRMQHALWREAIALVNDGVCDAETVDMAVKNSFGMRMPVLGPIENADLVGLDLTQDIHNVVLADICAETVPARILQDKISAGHLGMKTGKGFKDYTPEKAAQIKRNMIEHLLNARESKR